MTEKFDAIVVGAGPAGSSAAYWMAKEGLNVLVIERGEYPGSKNVSGALLHSRGLSKLFPDFWEEAPVERFITHRKLSFLAPESSMTMDFRDTGFDKPPYNGFTVLRSKFDPWLAEKAEEAGALLMTSTQVDDLLMDKGKVIGVSTRKEDGDVLADVVVIAEGANSLLTEKAGLAKHSPPAEMAVAAKEVIKLSKETINERFNLKGNEGASIHYIGDCTKGIPGGAFLYTNKDSVSLGLVCRISGLAEKQAKIFELVEAFKDHPHVKPLIKGGTVKEYSGHMIPERGYAQIPKLFARGLLVTGEAASFNFNNGFILRGMDYAIASGLAAAKAVIQCKSNGDFSESGLCVYKKELESTFVLKDLKRFKALPDILSNPRVFSTYPNLICDMGREIFEVNDSEHKRARTIFNDVRRRKDSKVGMARLIRDLLKIGYTV